MPRAVAFLLVCSFPLLAAAHPAPFSYVDVIVEPDRVRAALVVHDFDAAHELGIDRPERLLDPAVVRDHREQLVRILESRMQIRMDGESASMSWGEIEALSERQSLKLQFELDRPLRSTLELQALLFPYDPSHQTFVNIYEQGTLAHQAILDVNRQTLMFYAGNAQGRWAVVLDYFKAGVHHIAIGPDHVLFLLALLLLGGTVWRLAAIVTAFTLGHSATLSLAALGIVGVGAHIVEPAIALSIVVVGVDNLLVSRQRRKPASHGTAEGTSKDLRPWLAGAFGLIHGFGFAAVLTDIGLPRGALGWSLAAFNVGVEVGQLCIVLAAIALQRGVLAILRVDRALVAERFLTLGSIGVIAAGVYWFLQRIGLLAAM